MSTCDQILKAFAHLLSSHVIPKLFVFFSFEKKKKKKKKRDVGSELLFGVFLPGHLFACWRGFLSGCSADWVWTRRSLGKAVFRVFFVSCDLGLVGSSGCSHLRCRKKAKKRRVPSCSVETSHLLGTLLRPCDCDQQLFVIGNKIGSYRHDFTVFFCFRYFLSLSRLPLSLASACSQCYFLIVFGISIVLFKDEKVTIVRVVSIALCLGGLAMTAVSGLEGESMASNITMTNSSSANPNSKLLCCAWDGYLFLFGSMV